jgi:hypothetical protein
LLVLAATFLALLLSCTKMERKAAAYIEALPPEQIPGGAITEADLAGLPPVVRRYFEYSGVVGKPRIASFSFTIEGRIRQGPEAKWMPFVSRQYNLLSEPSRVFYIRTKNTPMSGLVTFLNDLIMSPLAYFSVPVTWRQLDDRRAELSLSHAGETVEAVLSFDEAGRLLNWESDDRYADVRGKPLPDRWSTPMKAYGEVSGLRIPTAGEAVHNYEGRPPYVYVELAAVKQLAWNRRGLPPEE